MTLKKKLDKLDKMVSKGKIIEAFEEFFANHVVTRGESGLQTKSKEEKLVLLKSFFNDMSETENITLHQNSLEGNISFSKFSFLFKNRDGKMLKWHEVIVRTWEDDQVIDEYYSTKSISELIKEMASAQPKKKTAKSEPKKVKSAKADKKAKVKPEPAAPEIKISEKPKATPEKVAAKTKRTAPTTAKTKADNLKLIEGIGPKIESFLKEDGINTFAKLAKANPDDIKNMMIEKGGTRYNANNPETWPAQAALAADGKMDELKALQGELKHGKAVN